MAIGLIALTGLLLFHAKAHHAENEEKRQKEKPAAGSPFEMPVRAKSLFEGIDLDLSKPAKAVSVVSEIPVSNPLADTLRVKLNLRIFLL